MDGLIACRNSLAHLVDGEVALGSHKHDGILDVRRLAQLIEQIGARNLFVAMGYLLAGCARFGYELVKSGHLADLRGPRLMALLDC